MRLLYSLSSHRLYSFVYCALAPPPGCFIARGRRVGMLIVVVLVFAVDEVGGCESVGGCSRLL